MSRQFAIMVRRDAGELAAGEWRRDGDRLEIACVSCGHAQELGVAVADDGTVEQLWPCASEACALMLWMELEGYSS
jgi:hypothetical protein